MRVVVALGFLLVAAVSPAAAQAPGQSPLDSYKAYLNVLAKASSLDELLPHYTKELADGLRKMPRNEQANYLKMNKQGLTDVKVTKDDTSASKAILAMTARTADGRSTAGTVTLVKEGGGWKIDDESWATPMSRDDNRP